ncbi:triacylglycerol lipase [Humibacter sp. RRB41]|uniref:esterase/lipase family protein n=1 Tax=Humibacter sp. RRB41 TaxID=2919946 RepID=UPI001FA94DB6|nr:alpha/beta hydrolase [Humibacter sp. RRB41]
MPRAESGRRSSRDVVPGEGSEPDVEIAGIDVGTVSRAVPSALADIAFLPGWRGLGARARRWMLRDREHPVDGSPVLLLPGVNESPRFLDPFAALALASCRPAHVVTTLGRNRSGVLATAEIAAAYLERHDLSGVTIVAHSKGGLVGKQLMAWEQTGPRVATMLAIATPFSGSVFASRMPDRALRAFAPTDRTLLDLAANRGVNGRIVSAFPAFDPQIPGGSELPDAAANVRVPVAGHFRVLGHPELWRLVRRVLRETDAPASAPCDGVSGTR